MNISKISGVKIDGIYACIPSREVDNRLEGEDLFGNSIEDLIKSTGIAKRRICPTNITGLDLCLKAAKELFKVGNINPCDIGGIVYVTFTPDNMMPNNSTYVQSILNLPNDIPAFDINLACSGYPYGLWISSMMAKSLNKKILLLDGDKQSHITSPYDKATALLFSDAGSATIISPGDSQYEWQFTFETNGSKREVLSIKDGGARNSLSNKSLLYNAYEDGSKRRNIDIKMDGLEVFKFVAQSVKTNLIEFLDAMAKKPENFDYLILHQANVYMMKQLCKKLGFGLEKMPVTADKYGNSSSSTIPVSIASELQEAIKGKELSLLISGFGAGLSVGSASIRLDKNISLGVAEYE
jgi:3-oxoacyl-[acyl-carrier-protein] synthase-3